MAMKKIIIGLLVCLFPLWGQARPLLSLVDIQGVRDNQLVGYGLVVGLSGTGDKSQTKFTSQSVKNMLSQFGVQLPANTDPKLKNVAAVAVHALGKEKVVGLILPETESNPVSSEYAEKHARALGIEHRQIEVTPTVDSVVQYEWRDEFMQKLIPEYRPGYNTT